MTVVLTVPIGQAFRNTRRFSTWLLPKPGRCSRETAIPWMTTDCLGTQPCQIQPNLLARTCAFSVVHLCTSFPCGRVWCECMHVHACLCIRVGECVCEHVCVCLCALAYRGQRVTTGVISPAPSTFFVGDKVSCLPGTGLSRQGELASELPEIRLGLTLLLPGLRLRGCDTK